MPNKTSEERRAEMLKYNRSITEAFSDRDYEARLSVARFKKYLADEKRFDNKDARSIFTEVRDDTRARNTMTRAAEEAVAVAEAYRIQGLDDAADGAEHVARILYRFDVALSELDDDAR